MKKYLYLLLLLFLPGCSNRGTATQEPSQEKTELHSDLIPLQLEINSLRSPVLSPETGEGNFSRGDEVCILYFAKENTEAVSTKYIVLSSTPKWSALGLPKTTKSVVIGGCYPYYPAGNNGKITLDASSGTLDFLLASPQTADMYTKANIKLPFKHAFSRIRINYTTDGTFTEAEMKTIHTTLTAKSSCVADLKTGTIDPSSASTPKSYVSVVGKQANIYVVPQKNNGKDDVTLSIGMNGNTYSYVLTGDIESGKQIICNFTAKRKTDGKEEISLTGWTIAPWVDNGTIEGDIEL